MAIQTSLVLGVADPLRGARPTGGAVGLLIALVGRGGVFVFPRVGKPATLFMGKDGL